VNNEEIVLLKGNDAIAEAALRAGCTAYFGYPITPQNEITNYMAENMAARKGIFIQAESETAAINMVYGASAAGARAMTSSSSPGVSLKQEGMSYAAGADVPLVLVNVVRGGPGLGSISPAQSDYFQSTRGGGHGDYRCVVLAPKNVQECADFTCLAFDLADKYRMPAIVLADGLLGQMMEGVRLPAERAKADIPKRDWTVGGMYKAPREARHISSIHLEPSELEALTAARFRRYDELAKRETRFEALDSGADIILAAYGSSARIAAAARETAIRNGLRVGLFRPISLFPFPYRELEQAGRGKTIIVIEMSLGQFIEDVKLAFFGSKACPRIKHITHCGGVIPSEAEILAEIERAAL
jgi:2-oxoglutarate ferredoxin oxidoreductase subunit alpha